MNAGEVLLELAFEGRVIHWRGPPPYLFVQLPSHAAADVHRAAQTASYGWGCVPVEASVSDHAFTTALFPKDGGYLLPVMIAVRKATGVSLDDEAAVTVTVRAPR